MADQYSVCLPPGVIRSPARKSRRRCRVPHERWPEGKIMGENHARTSGRHKPEASSCHTTRVKMRPGTDPKDREMGILLSGTPKRQVFSPKMLHFNCSHLICWGFCMSRHSPLNLTCMQLFRQNPLLSSFSVSRKLTELSQRSYEKTDIFQGCG